VAFAVSHRTNRCGFAGKREVTRSGNRRHHAKICSAMTVEKFGIENPEKIDVVSLAPDGDYIVLAIAQTTDWDGSDRLLLALQAKWKSYLAFAVDGQLRRLYPQYAHLPWKILLSCQTEPDDRTKEFVRRADSATRAEGGEFLIHRQGLTSP
jgi:hypothetical protein